MNQDLGLRILSQILGWSDDEAREEFAWLRLMARLKYDGYRDFLAGARFIESLAIWLQQFKNEDRKLAYAFVRSSLVYVGPGEMQRLVELFFPSVVQNRLQNIISARLGIPKYKLPSNLKAQKDLEILRRKTLFMALSEGARMDTVRHSNAGVLSNEQFVVATQLDRDKWHDLLGNLRTDLKDPGAKFALVYLIDDFMGTGTSLLRYNEEKKKWGGKLVRFRDSVSLARKSGEMPFENNWQLGVHHYLAGDAAVKAVVNREIEARSAFIETSKIPSFIQNLLKPLGLLQNERTWAGDVQFSFGMIFPPGFPINEPNNSAHPFIPLTNSYYDPIIRTKHTDVGGVKHMGLGYGGCALPLILEHNTPNNSVSLLWAETDGGVRDGVEAPAMRPLFRRRQRHS